jgi:hypothetical protein
LALVVFDSVPAAVVAATSQGWQALAMAPANEPAYRPQRRWRDSLLDGVERCVATVRERVVARYRRDPQVSEDRHVKALKRRTQAH